MRHPLIVARLAIAIGILVGSTCACASAPVAASYSPKNASLVAPLAKVAPDAKWGTPLHVNLDGDDKPDTVVLGTTEKEVVIAVVLGAKPDKPVVYRLPWNPNAQDGICAVPSTAHITAEKCPADAEPTCRPAPGQAAGTKQELEAVRLDAGECDAFHFYFDGQAVRWWRR